MFNKNRIMNFSKICISLLIPFIILNACGDSHQLEIKGDASAIKLAQSMLDAMGGKAKWARLKSVYVRTLSFTPGQANNYVLEEWIDLDVPKMLNKQSSESSSIIQILDGNDGWVIKNKNVLLMPSESITNMLKWHDHYMMRSLQHLAQGGENREVRMNGEKRFDLYENNKFMGGFELSSEYVIIAYFTEGSKDSQNSIFFNEWGEYKGMKYPLEIRTSSGMSLFKTDYWDPRETSADKAFNISFNPNIAVERFN
jgi:hypothetical protein